MEKVLLNAASLFAVILSGFLLKRVNLLSKADGDTLSAIIINVTLPAAIVVNLSALTISTSLLFLIALGILFNIIMVLAGFFTSKKEEETNRKFLMYTVSGYNIGNFALPFTQSFLPGAVPFLAMFDIGNSVMLAGGTTAMIEALAGGDKHVTIGSRLKPLLTSVTFLTYWLMLFLRLGQVQLPEFVLSAAGVMGNANTFLSMFMIGLYLDLYLPKKYRKIVVKVLVSRYFFGALLAVAVYLLPLPKLLTTVLCLLCVGPIATFGVINSVRAGMKSEAVGFASSVSFLISFVLMTVVLLVLL